AVDAHQGDRDLNPCRSSASRASGRPAHFFEYDQTKTRQNDELITRSRQTPACERHRRLGNRQRRIRRERMSAWPLRGPSVKVRTDASTTRSTPGPPERTRDADGGDVASQTAVRNSHRAT